MRGQQVVFVFIFINAKAIETATEILEFESRSAKWIENNALVKLQKII